jgi:hypothetical protein
VKVDLPDTRTPDVLVSDGYLSVKEVLMEALYENSTLKE